MSSDVRNIIILGSGPAGLTAALYTARANLSPLVAKGPQPGGQLMITTDVENYPGFSGGILGPDLMKEMQAQAERFGTEVLTGLATSVDLSTRPFKISFDDKVVKTNSLIISTGATARTLGLEKDKELMGFGLSTCATCDGAFFQDEEIVVIGGGDSACEEAVHLTKFGKKVTLVHRRDELRASKIMADRVKNHPKIEILWNKNLVDLLGDKKSGLTGGVLEDSKTGEREEISCAAVFYAIGHTPNTKLFEGLLDMDDDGYLITQPDSTKTNIEGVFACGDVQDHVFRQAITAAGTGCMAALETERFLAEFEE